MSACNTDVAKQACDHVGCASPSTECNALPGTPCDDGDACTTEDTCASGLCVGNPVLCDSPPEPACSTSTTVVAYDAPAQCAQGACPYAHRTYPCANCASGFCDAPNWSHAAQLGGNDGDDVIFAITVQDDGALYAVGQFSGERSFGDHTVAASGESDLFLIKYSSTYELLWAKTAGGERADAARAVLAVPDLGVVVAGTFSGTLEFDELAITASGVRDFFIAKFDSDGRALWLTHGTSDGSFDLAHDLALGPDGTIAVTGEYWGSLTLGGTSVPTHHGHADVFTAKLAEDGTPLWLRTGGGIDWDWGLSLVVLDNGDVITAGAFARGQYDTTATFGDETLVTSGEGPGAFLVGYSASGEQKWVRTLISPTASRFLDVVQSPDGGVIAAGYVTDEGSIGATHIVTAGGRDAIIASFDHVGDFKWMRQFGGVGDERGVALDVAEDQSLLLASEFQETVSLPNNHEPHSNGGTDILLMRIVGAGFVNWSLTAGGVADDSVKDLISTPIGLIVAGAFKSPLTLGSRALISSGSDHFDAFLATVHPD